MAPFERLGPLNYCHCPVLHYVFVFGFQAPFETLDPELLSSNTMKYGKSVSQLEKGLPPNGVVPQLKLKVEDMKEKVIIFASPKYTFRDRF